MIGLLFIVIVTWVIVFVLYLASEGKIKYLDDINEHRLHDAIQSDLKRIREEAAEKAKKEKFYAGQLRRRNPGRRKGEVRKKKTIIKGFGKR